MKTEQVPALIGETDKKQGGKQIRTLEWDMRDEDISVSAIEMGIADQGTLELRHGISLVVQGLTPQAPNAGGLDSILDQGTINRSHMPQLKSLHATVKIKDPMYQN